MTRAPFQVLVLLFHREPDGTLRYEDALGRLEWESNRRALSELHQRLTASVSA